MFKPIYFRFHGICNEKTTFEEFEEFSEQIGKEYENKFNEKKKQLILTLIY